MKHSNRKARKDFTCHYETIIFTVYKSKIVNINNVMDIQWIALY